MGAQVVDNEYLMPGVGIVQRPAAGNGDVTDAGASAEGLRCAAGRDARPVAHDLCFFFFQKQICFFFRGDTRKDFAPANGVKIKWTLGRTQRI